MPDPRAMRVIPDEIALATARQVLLADAAAVASLPDQLGDDFLDVVDLLVRCAGKVLVAGMGTSGATARRIAHLLSVGGTPAMFVSAADGLHGGLGAVTDSDVVIAISKGGESDELNEFVRRARERGAVAVAMTSEAGSALAAAADRVLVTRTDPEADYGRMIAMGSSLANCALGDALAAVTMGVREQAWELFAHSHPGGAVGKLLTDRATA
ncbi:SIS domain-containing protein [Nakamurella sp. YIM 132087]|uniref:SIS domain-containing protein n=1 Tax=Nakamurella alba TaxID=2665158 RepID=A0A7K1FU00_9ACTN|nr:SIS domain-containing protein [Nakamurella alba]MTD16304.1 SIS domain-containing protein [Nakamurella alba]